MRKTLVRLLLGIFLLVFAAGCRQQEVSPELIVHNADELASSSVGTSQGGSFVLLFYSSLSWEASISPVNTSWLSISSASGNAGENSMVLATTINASAEPRSADIVLSCGNVFKSVTVRQEGLPEEDFFEVSPASISVSAAGGDIAVNISTNMDYTVEVTVPEWIAMVSGAGVKEGELIFRVSENQSTEDRTGIILFRTDESDYEVTVLQAGKEPEDDPSGGNEGVGNDDEHNW